MNAAPELDVDRMSSLDSMEGIIRSGPNRPPHRLAGIPGFALVYAV